MIFFTSAAFKGFGEGGVLRSVLDWLRGAFALKRVGERVLGGGQGTKGNVCKGVLWKGGLRGLSRRFQ